jgi:hypothetical protein
MAERAISSTDEKRWTWGKVVLLVLPVIILGVVILVFLTTGGGLNLTSPRGALTWSAPLQPMH